MTKEQEEKYEALPIIIKEAMSQAHTHGELCTDEELVYKEADVIFIVNIALSLNKEK